VSLEKKRRAVGSLEQSLNVALLQDPFVALDDKLIESGLVPRQGDPATGGWGRTTAEPSALRLRAEQVAELAELGLAEAHRFRVGDATAEQAMASMQEVFEAMQAPFEGLVRVGGADVGDEPHGGSRDRRWVFDGKLTLEVMVKKAWTKAAVYEPEPGLLGLKQSALDALARYERSWQRRDEQTATLQGMLAKVSAAWDKHPARRVAQEYLIGHDSPAASELRKATELLDAAQETMRQWNLGSDAERLGWRRSPEALDMFEVGPTFGDARVAMETALRGLATPVPGKRLSPSGIGALARDARPTSEEVDPESEMAIYSRRRSIDAMLGHIESLYQYHPVRRRFEVIMESMLRGDVTLEQGSGLDERIQTLDDLYMASGVIAHEFVGGQLDFEQARQRLDGIRNELAAIDGSFDPSVASDPVDQVCATIMGAPPRFSSQEHRPIRIDDHRALAALAAIEGTGWLSDQMRDRAEPTGFLANRDAWTVLRDLGPDAQGLRIADLLDDGGTIHGGDGRLYEVRADGRIALLSTSTDDVGAEAAERFGLLVT
jgi:hypothetical protein